MPFRIFRISAVDPEPELSELNQWCATQRTVSIQREFVACGDASFWSICVQSDPETRAKASTDSRRERTVRRAGTDEIDYMSALSGDEFAVYAQLRDVRKALGLAEGVPPYSVATNAHLGQMVVERLASLTALRRVDGFGDGRMRKYGEAFATVLADKVPGLGEAVETFAQFRARILGQEAPCLPDNASI